MKKHLKHIDKRWPVHIFWQARIKRSQVYRTGTLFHLNNGENFAIRLKVINNGSYKEMFVCTQFREKTSCSIKTTKISHKNDFQLKDSLLSFQKRLGMVCGRCHRHQVCPHLATLKSLVCCKSCFNTHSHSSFKMFPTSQQHYINKYQNSFLLQYDLP